MTDIFKIIPMGLFQKALIKILSNPLFLFFFSMRTMYNMYYGHFFQVFYNGTFTILLFMFVIFLGERILQITWLKQKYETFRSDAQHIETYWQENLQSVLWFFRFAYLTFGGLILWNVSLCLGGYEISPNGTLELFLPEQPGILISNIAFALGGFVATAAAQLTMQSSIAYMLPAVEGPLMQTCRYCVNHFGKVTLVCVGGSYMVHDVPVFQNTLPVDAARVVIGKPLLEDTVGHFIYANLRPFVESGQIDINLITDPKTGRVTNALMIEHSQTTYRDLLSAKAAPGFVTAYVAPEVVIATGIKNWALKPIKDLSSWARKTFTWTWTKSK